MASVEQPPKKRKLYEPLPEPPPSSPPPPPPLATKPTPPSPQTLSPPSQEEILEKWRNKDEIRSVYEGYKQIRRCLLQKDAPSSMADLEQSYLTLITSSRELAVVSIRFKIVLSMMTSNGLQFLFLPVLSGWWMSFGFAIGEALIFACYSLPYSIYVASYRVKHVMVTSVLLVCGAMTITWICDTISESGFVSAVSWWPYVLAVLGIFTTITMWPVVVTEGCRKVKLQYYSFDILSPSHVKHCN